MAKYAFINYIRTYVHIMIINSTINDYQYYDNHYGSGKSQDYDYGSGKPPSKGHYPHYKLQPFTISSTLTTIIIIMTINTMIMAQENPLLIKIIMITD